MTLDEVFEKYSNDKKIIRTSLSHMPPATVKSCKSLKAWASQETRNMGFFIPKFMIDDAHADDWELKNE